MFRMHQRPHTATVWHQADLLIALKNVHLYRKILHVFLTMSLSLSLSLCPLLERADGELDERNLQRVFDFAS